MRLALHLRPWPNEMWYLGAQMGVTDAVTGVPSAGPGAPRHWDFLSLVQLRQQFADTGLNATVIEDSPPMEKIRLGVEGREEEFENIAEFITNMGAAGFRVWCYNWMVAFNWLRTSVATPVRGGAVTTSYDHAFMKDAPPTPTGLVSEEQLWDSYAWFIERIVPIAKSANVSLALHPDDPPLSPIRGVARIMSSVENFERALSLHDDPHHAITFCQGNFRLMTDDIPKTIRHFGATGRVPFVHFRDTLGTPEKFRETFHDDGPTDMLEAMATYKEVGFDGPMRPDHVPTLYGEPNDPPGYTTRGRLYAIGYMRGLLEAVQSGRYRA
jgi:mannonate dehydratase